MARAIRSNTRVDLIVLTTCVVLALAARALPNTMRDPVATTMRRGLFERGTQLRPEGFPGNEFV